MTKNYSIGIDMGVNNVGWSILNNDTKKLENYGVRLFPTSNDAKERREVRNTRRRLKRKETRLDDTLYLLKKYGFNEDNTIEENLIEKRVKGLNEKLEKQDIVNILCYMIKHRGYIPFGDEEVTLVDLNGKYPCEFYYEMYKNGGKYRNRKMTVRITDNEKEIKKILETQSKYYKNINQDFINKYLNILTRKRKYWEGPGSINDLTPFGRFKTQEDVENYLEEKRKNPSYEKYIYEDLIKKCDYELEERCCCKLNIYYELFNMYQDFINVSFKNIEELENKDCFYETKNGLYKLNKKGLLMVKDYCMNNFKLKYTDILKKLFNTDKDNISGYRIDKDHKPEFSTLNSYRKIMLEFTEKGFDTTWVSDYNCYNEIMEKMTLTPGGVEFIKEIENNKLVPYKFNEEEKSLFKELKEYFNKKTLLSYGSLSQKILQKAINDMLDLEKNFMQVSRIKDYGKEARENFIKQYKKTSNKLEINASFVDDIIASPQVKKSLRQAIKIINAIIEKEGCLPVSIAIESTKELNSDKKKKEIEKEQKIQENLRKQASNYLSVVFGDSNATETNILKIMLYNETNGHCAYCNKPLNINDIFTDNIQVDHILPISKSFNDSFNNKIISCKKCNDDKKNNTPYQFLKNKNYFEEFEKRVLENKNISDYKKDNLLYKDDLDKYKTRFFNRNLRDTAYATTELINQIEIFNNYLEILDKKRINTLSVPGQITSSIRNRYVKNEDKTSLEKNRDAGVFHHAVDASIVVSVSDTHIGQIMLKAQNDKEYWIKNKSGYDDIYKYLINLRIDDTINQIEKINNENIKISKQVSKNPQGKLANSNIYKMIKKDNEQYIINQIDNIYTFDFKKDENKKLFEKLLNEENNEFTLLCYDNDKNTFNYIKKIYNEYKNEKGNPFVNYLIDKGEISDGNSLDYDITGIRMVTKKGNGPIIKRLRYYSKKNDLYILNKKNINKKDSNYLALDSLKQFCVKVYVDNDNKKFVFLPIYTISLDPKTKKVNENNEFYKLFYNKYIGNKNVTFFADIYNGNKLEITKKDGTIVSGYYSTFDKSANRLETQNGYIFVCSDKKISIVHTDILGNEKKRLTKEL